MLAYIMQRHRGIDESGTYREQNVELLHSWLNILDLLSKELAKVLDSGARDEKWNPLSTEIFGQISFLDDDRNNPVDTSNGYARASSRHRKSIA